MVLDGLCNRLKESLQRIAGRMFVDEKAIDELVKEIQKALLNADVNVKLVFELTKRIKERAIADKRKISDNRAKIVDIVYDELSGLLGGEKSEIIIEKKKPFKIMFVGIYGSGKSTSVGKIGHYYQKRGYKVAAVGLDVHRAAAPEQLKQVCENVKIASFIDKNEKNALKIYKKFEKEFERFDILLIDTAGRHELDSELVEEIKLLNKEIKPDEKLLVMNADLGQGAEKLAKGFHDSCGVSGIMITKMDGTAKGGGALSGAAISGGKIRFIGGGEKADDLELFNPKGFVSRLLGMGDLEALLEKANEVIDEKKAGDLSKRLLEGDFTLVDLYEQMEAMNKMGPLSKVMEMIPGFGQMKLPDGMMKVQEDKLKRWKIAMQSMTKTELENPEIIDSNRLQRISKGSHVPAGEIREMIKQYRQSKKLIAMMKDGDPEKMMRKMQGKFKFK